MFFLADKWKEISVRLGENQELPFPAVVSVAIA
jgi:hypothetical protein